MAVSKKTVGSSKTPKSTAKSPNTKVAGTKITTAKIHTTVVVIE
jgi:hypothetical protein